MTAQHTPGPWKRLESEDYPDDFVTGPNGELIAACWKVAHIDLEPLGDGHDEALANARLIAAAPDLLDALKYLARHINADPSAYDGDDDGALGRLMYAAEAAIAKAEGRSNA